MDEGVLEREIAEVCGTLHAATGRLVTLIAEVLEAESWQGWGVRSPEQWVAWKCGVSPRRAWSLVQMAKRAHELPETHAAQVAGELSEDQVVVICRHAPTAIDGEVAAMAKTATVTQLRRVLGKYSLQERAEKPAPDESRRVSFASTPEGNWRLSALLPPDEGAVWEKALTETREELFRIWSCSTGPQRPTVTCTWGRACRRACPATSAVTAGCVSCSSPLGGP